MSHLSLCALALLSACGSDGSPADSGANGGAGNASGATGSGATDATGGSAGSATGGAGGSATGGSATGGAGGSGSGGAGGSGSGGAPVTGNIRSLEGGRYHTCLTTESGAIYCWGQGAYGALGNDGSYRGVPTLALVVDDAIEAQCGGRFSCARRASKALFCWGEDQAGQLGGPSTKACGDAVIDSVCAPVPQAVAGVVDAAAVALGRNHACALALVGSVSCWGDNAHGQLGDANLAPREQPLAVAGVDGAAQITAGDEHSCALLGAPGKVLCWGQNANAQVGKAVSDAETSPVEVGGIPDAEEVVAGGEHTCARRANGSVACWGYNYFGQLGRGSKQPTRATSPAEVAGVNDAVQLALGRYHSCARRAGGKIACWGYNSKGELGDGTSQDRVTPVEVVGVEDAVFIAAGSWHTCAILASGPVLCWGDNLGGQLGQDGVNKVSNPTPLPVKELPTN